MDAGEWRRQILLGTTPHAEAKRRLSRVRVVALRLRKTLQDRRELIGIVEGFDSYFAIVEGELLAASAREISNTRAIEALTRRVEAIEARKEPA